jgi:16S rRNA (cytosine1402-N4)-methyltransferase
MDTPKKGNDPPKRDNPSPHISVLYHEVLEALKLRTGGRYADLTLGAGGHAKGILEASSPDGLLLGMDVDPQALNIAREVLSPFGTRVKIIQASYLTLGEQLEYLGWDHLDGITLDLGASSMQFDTPERGFSFSHDGPLDMRFNPENDLTAEMIINTWDKNQIADILFNFGEERKSRKIAREIVANRPLKSTKQLADLIKSAIGDQKQKIHPATRSFQALRIAVNGELDAVEKILHESIKILAPGGRLTVIAFHSLEDRIAKNIFREASRPLRDSTDPMNRIIREPIVDLITKKPIIPTELNKRENPRARSAKLRVVEKCAD